MGHLGHVSSSVSRNVFVFNQTHSLDLSLTQIVCLGLQCFVLAKLTVRGRKVATLIYEPGVVAVWMLSPQ